MNFDNFESADPHILLGRLNTELRNNAESLDDLCKTHDIDEQELREKMAEGDYEYRVEINQFR